MMQLTELLSPRPDPLWHLVKQAGVDSIVTLLDGAEQDQRMFQSVGAGDGDRASRTTGDAAPWSEASLARVIDNYSKYDLAVVSA